MRCDAQIDVQIAGRSSANAGFTASANANAAAVVHARRHFHRQTPLDFAPSATRAIRTRLLNDLAVAGAFGARRLRDELSERCLAHHPLHAGPAAAIAWNDKRSRRSAAAATRFA